MNRIQNTKRILFSDLLNKSIHIFLPLINRTIIIYSLGAEFTGLSGLFSSILQVLSLAEFGFNTAVVYSLYEPLAKNDKESIITILSWLRKIYHEVGLVIIPIGVFAAPFLTFFIHGAYPNTINLYILFLLYLTNSGISYFLFAFKEAILIADQRSDVTTNIKSAITILVNVVQCVVLVVFKNYYLYIIVLIIGTLLSNLLINRAVDKRYPYLSEKASNSTSFQIPTSMKKQLTGLLINRLSNVSRNAFDSVIISASLGLIPTAIYGNYYLIYSSVFGFSSIFSNSMKASVGNSMVLRKPSDNYENLLDFSLLYSWIIGWCSIALSCLYQPFMKLWVGEDLMMPEYTMLLFPIYFYFINMNHIRNQYIYGKGMWWKMKWSYLLESIGNLVLNIVLGKLLGITGVLIATIITIFFCNYLMCNNVLFREYFKEQSIWTFYKQQGYYLFVWLVTGITTYSLCQILTENLIIRGLICVVIPNIIFLVLYRPCSRWHSSMQIVKRIIKT